ncbi:MAG: DNA alkylation repair protein [Candidatus Dojkabacteria bacterium]
MNVLEAVIKELNSLANAAKVKDYQWFFKTGKGEYAEGDKFIGVNVPNQRKVSKKFYKEATLQDFENLLTSGIHEYRLTALMMMCYKFEKATKEADIALQKSLHTFYLQNTKYVNNWDLVDTSAGRLVGDYLLDKDRSLLYEMAKEKDLWRNRISIIATSRLIARGQIDDTFKLSKILLEHPHDLIHKAVGWMLREAGKVDLDKLLQFINANYSKMPRTMLRYAIEKLPEKQRKEILSR